MNWHFWKSVAAQPRGGFSLKAAVLGPGSSASICSRRSVCKHGRSPDQTPLNQTAKSLANAWLSLPTVWLRVCVRSSTEKERWHDCARWFKSASSHYLVLAFTLENIQTWGSGCRTLPEWSAGMARCLFFYSALRLQIHKSVPTPAHTPAPSHAPETLSQSPIGLREQGRVCEAGWLIRWHQAAGWMTGTAPISCGLSWRCFHVYTQWTQSILVVTLVE